MWEPSRFLPPSGGRQPQSTLAQAVSGQSQIDGSGFRSLHREHHYLATEGEKLDYFAGKLGLNRGYLPQRVYRSGQVRKSPRAISLTSFRCFSLAHRARHLLWSGLVIRTAAQGSLQGSIPACCSTRAYSVGWIVLGSSTSLGMSGCFRRQSIFGRVCGNGARAVSVSRERDIERLREHFWARDLFERRETSSFGKAGLDRLREELAEFRGPEYEALYCECRERGDCILGGSAESTKSSQGALRPTGSITITSCSASSAGRCRHETNVEYRGPWRQTS